MNPTQIREALRAKQAEIAAFNGKAMTADDKTTLKGLLAEFTELQGDLELAKGVEAAAASSKSNAGPGIPLQGDDDKTPQSKSVRTAADAVAEHKSEIASLLKGNRSSVSLGTVNIGRKALFDTATIGNEPNRLPFVVQPRETTTLTDLMLQGQTDSDLKYYAEVAVGLVAGQDAHVAEGATKAEVEFTTEPRTDALRKIAVYTDVSTEALRSPLQVQSYIEGRLVVLVKEQQEADVLIGTGDADEQIEGILERTGVQTHVQASIADDTDIDAIARAILKVGENGKASATVGVFNWADWGRIRLTKDLNGQYVLGPPTAGLDANPWGLQVRLTASMPALTGLVGAFSPHAQFFTEEGQGEVEITLAPQHADNAIKNKVTIIAETRGALAVYRPAAFCIIEFTAPGA